MIWNSVRNVERGWFQVAKKAKKAVFHLICPKCGYQKQTGDKPSIAPKAIERSPKESIAMIGKEEQKLAYFTNSQDRTPQMRKQLSLGLASSN